MTKLNRKFPNATAKFNHVRTAGFFAAFPRGGRGREVDRVADGYHRVQRHHAETPAGNATIYFGKACFENKKSSRNFRSGCF
jgi:hypothetical protein